MPTPRFYKRHEGKIFYRIEYYRPGSWFLTLGVRNFEIQFNNWPPNSGKE